jgi:hypothetical protein
LVLGIDAEGAESAVGRRDATHLAPEDLERVSEAREA